MDPIEKLFWTLMRTFETMSLAHYEKHHPSLLTPGHAAIAERLTELVPDDSHLAGTPLEDSFAALAQTAVCDDPERGLIVQALLLHNIRRTIYGIVVEKSEVSYESRELAADALSASADVCATISPRIRQEIGTGETFLAAFSRHSPEVLLALDGLSTGVDAVFGERFAIHFIDILGDFISDLVPICTGLGADRRKLMCELTEALMGI